MMGSERRRLKRKFWLSIVAAVCFCLAVVSMIFVPHRTSSPSALVAAIDPEIVASLNKEYIDVSPASDANSVAVSDAIDAARKAIPLVNGAPLQANLVTFTDNASGDGKPDGTVIPTYAHRVAWAVVFTGVQVPMFGPPDIKGVSYTANTVVFVDAKTGETSKPLRSRRIQAGLGLLR